MLLKWGTYGFAANACQLAASSELRVNDGGQPIAVHRRIDVDGFLDGDGQSEIMAAAVALTTALAVPYQDLILYRDDNQPSDTKLLNAGSTTGVLAKDLRFPDSRGGEYSTFRHFTFYAEAEYPVTNSLGLLLSFTERLSFSGGGPIYRHRMAINGRPQKQLIYPESIYRAIQEGEAVGYRAKPAKPLPIWPDDMIEAPEVDVTTPRRRGREYTDFRVTWRYTFESDRPLVGEPTVWRG